MANPTEILASFADREGFANGLHYLYLIDRIGDRHGCSNAEIIAANGFHYQLCDRLPIVLRGFEQLSPLSNVETAAKTADARTGLALREALAADTLVLHLPQHTVCITPVDGRHCFLVGLSWGRDSLSLTSIKGENGLARCRETLLAARPDRFSECRKMGKMSPHPCSDRRGLNYLERHPLVQSMNEIRPEIIDILHDFCHSSEDGTTRRNGLHWLGLLDYSGTIHADSNMAEEEDSAGLPLAANEWGLFRDIISSRLPAVMQNIDGFWKPNGCSMETEISNEPDDAFRVQASVLLMPQHSLAIMPVDRENAFFLVGLSWETTVDFTYSSIIGRGGLSHCRTDLVELGTLKGVLTKSDFKL
jgi:hypothetical protein